MPLRESMENSKKPNSNCKAYRVKAILRRLQTRPAARPRPAAILPLGKHMDGSVFPLTNGLWFWSVIIALSAWTLVQRHGDPARAA